MRVSNQEEVSKLCKSSFNYWVADIEDWALIDIFVLPINFRIVTSQVPDPGKIALFWTQACCGAPDSKYVHISVVAGEQDFFFVIPK